LFSKLCSAAEPFEIVFCSMDRNEAEYKKYAETMPWWCLPYAISTLPRLTAMYQAHGMPHLVVIDAKNGSTITTNGVDCLQEDPVGQNFPWRPQRVVDVLPAEYMVVENEENEVFYPLSDLDDKYLLLYFSAKTCSLSQEFTPWLVKAYNILKKQQPDDFELLFVSGDDSVAGFYKYWSEMTFGAVPYEDQDARRALESRFEITSYPQLIMLGPRPNDDADNFGDRPIINKEVRAVIENGDYITDFPFYPKPWGDLCKTTDDINMHKCLVVFHEGGDENDQLDVEDAVRDAAEEYHPGDEYIKFYWAFDATSALAASIRNACQLGDAEDELTDVPVPTMVLLDIKNDGYFYVSDEIDITPETIKSFITNYKSARRGQI